MFAFTKRGKFRKRFTKRTMYKSKTFLWDTEELAWVFVESLNREFNGMEQSWYLGINFTGDNISDMIDNSDFDVVAETAHMRDSANTDESWASITTTSHKDPIYSSTADNTSSASSSSSDYSSSSSSSCDSSSSCSSSSDCGSSD